MTAILEHIRNAVESAKQDPKNRKGKSLITAAVRKIGRENFDLVEKLSKDEIFVVCEQLLETGSWEEEVIAFDWAFRIRKQYETSEFTRFENWLKKYVHGWGSCDDFCTHAFGHLIFTFPEHILTLKTWTKSDNRWFRRAAAVVLIYGIRRQQNFQAAFEIADLLLMDGDDLVQKGYGWMLKEISNKDPQPVFEFVMQRKTRMPRTALRYAIEKLDPTLRKRAMEK
jgi:3-methyladenine DNA glycosylase AlkD